MQNIEIETEFSRKTKETSRQEESRYGEKFSQYNVKFYEMLLFCAVSCTIYTEKIEKIVKTASIKFTLSLITNSLICCKNSAHN